MFAPVPLTSLSPEEITVFIVRRLEAALPGLALELRLGAPNKLTVIHPNAGELTLNLGALMQEVQDASPPAAQKIVDTFVSRACHAVKPPKLSLDRVFPGLRPQSWVAKSSCRAKDGMIGEGPGDLVTVVLSEHEEAVGLLNEATVTSSGLRPEEVFEAAEQNFVNQLSSAFYAATPSEDVVCLGLGNVPWLGSSLLFVPSLITQVMQERGWSHALLAVPTLETVDLVDASSRSAKRIMERWMVDHADGPNVQSELVYSFACGDTEYRPSHRFHSSNLLSLN